MYSIGIYLYILAIKVAALFGHKKARKMLRGHREIWRTLRERIAPEDRPVWFHAASLGEFEQGRILMERLKREKPERKILLTFFSPSGYEVRRDFAAADAVCYMPFDTLRNARRFLRLAHPEMAIFIKYEFWADHIYQCHKMGIPVYSISSIFRPRQIFFRLWGKGYSIVLRWVTHFFVQNEQSRLLLASKGLTNVTVTGDTRLDRVAQIRKSAKSLPIVEQFVTKDVPVFIAGSSWPPDEDVYLPYFVSKNWKLIIATHEVNAERTANLRERIEGLGKRVVTYSEAEALSADELKSYDVLLIDCFGLLSSIYRYANVAYVGGGFGVSIHNVPEAAVYGIPVLFGPNNKKFQEAQDLLRLGGSFEVVNAEDFAQRMDALMGDDALLHAAGKASHDYILQNAGASDKIYQALFSGQ